LSGLWIVRPIPKSKPIAALWAHPAPGATVLLGKPQAIAWEEDHCQIETVEVNVDLQHRLVERAIGWAEQTGCEMLQAVTEPRDKVFQVVLEKNQIPKLVDLVYVSSPTLVGHQSSTVDVPDDSFSFAKAPPCADNLERWYRLLEATYVNSCDCPALNGRRSLSSTVAGYLATGTTWEDGWVMLRQHETASPTNLPNSWNSPENPTPTDMGCFILADHPDSDFVELVYFGLTPAARGKSLGLTILAEASRLTRKIGRSRIIAAVDRKNLPALRLYAAANFVALEERVVFARVFTV
jgi:GNAT superfamily N-acetyltransferase